jgi:hypothetical protein
MGNPAWGNGYHKGHADGLGVGLVVATATALVGVLASAPVAPRIKAVVGRLRKRDMGPGRSTGNGASNGTAIDSDELSAES